MSVARSGRPDGRTALLPALLLGVGAACLPGPEMAPAQELRLVEWPGQDGRRVVLDQALRVRFDRPLDPGLRPGALGLEEQDPATQAWDPVGSLAFEVAGSYLILHPALPLRPSLDDGSLRPGRRYRLLLLGVPHLAAVTSPRGAALVGDRLLEFETLPASDPGVLGGRAPSGEPLRLLLPGAGERPVVLCGDGGRLQIPLAMPVDPRTLREPAVLRDLSSQEERAVALELSVNGWRGAVLEAQVGSLPGPHQLVLPEALEGLGGERLLLADRTLRVRPRP